MPKARSRASAPKAYFGDDSVSNRDPSIGPPPASNFQIDTGAGSGLGLFQGVRNSRFSEIKEADSPIRTPIDSPSMKSIPGGLGKHAKTHMGSLVGFEF